MNYEVKVYNSENIVFETHKLAHGYHGKDVTGNSFVYPKDMDDRRY